MTNPRGTMTMHNRKRGPHVPWLEIFAARLLCHCAGWTDKDWTNTTPQTYRSRKTALNPVCKGRSVGCCHSTAAVGQPTRASEGGKPWQGGRSCAVCGQRRGLDTASAAAAPERNPVRGPKLPLRLHAADGCIQRRVRWILPAVDAVGAERPGANWPDHLPPFGRRPRGSTVPFPVVGCRLLC
jgi:hypothetical protein